MSDETNESKAEAIDYKAEVARLSAEVARLHEENKGHRLKKKEAESLLEKQQREAEEWQGKYNELHGKVRETSHKGAFQKVARELRVRDEAVEDLYALSKYTPEGDEPDEGRIKGLIEATVKAKPYFLAPEEAPQEAQKGGSRPLLPPGPGVARTSLETKARTQVSKADMRNPGFMMKHQKEIAQGLKDGTIEIV